MNATNRNNPRVRAYGKARIEITRQAKDEAEWLKLWKPPSQPYPFRHGMGWNMSVEYIVDDYAAEIGFLIDVLGFPILSFSPSSAQLTNPEEELLLIVSAAREGERPTPPGTVRINLHIKELDRAIKELAHRGVDFYQTPGMADSAGDVRKASFQTPSGLWITLWELAEDNRVAEGNAWQDDATDSFGEQEEEYLDEAEEDDQGQEMDQDMPRRVAVEAQSGRWQRVATPVESGAGNAVNPGKRTNGKEELTYTPIEVSENENGEEEDLDEYP